MTNAKCLIRKKTLGPLLVQLFFIVGCSHFLFFSPLLFPFLFDLQYLIHSVTQFSSVQVSSVSHVQSDSPIFLILIQLHYRYWFFLFIFKRASSHIYPIRPLSTRCFIICDCHGLGSPNNCKVGRRSKLARYKKNCRSKILVQRECVQLKGVWKCVSLWSCNDGQGGQGLDNNKYLVVGWACAGVGGILFLFLSSRF